MTLKTTDLPLPELARKMLEAAEAREKKYTGFMGNMDEADAFRNYQTLVMHTENVRRLAAAYLTGASDLALVRALKEANKELRGIRIEKALKLLDQLDQPEDDFSYSGADVVVYQETLDKLRVILEGE